MDILDINKEDLDQPEPPRRGGRSRPEPAEEDLLVIEPEDLQAVPAPPAGPPTFSPGYPPAVPPGYKPGAGRLLALGRVAPWSIFQMALAGALGGFLAWAFTEPFISDDQRGGANLVLVLMQMAGFGAVLGGLIGAALGAVEGISNRLAERAVRGALMGLGIGGLGGGLGGLFGQIAYSAAGGGGAGLGQQIVVRALAWSLVGLFVGIGQGAHTLSGRKVVNGLLGGALGGFIGGLLFDPLGILVGALGVNLGGSPGLLSRLVGMTVLGLCTGAAIGLVEELRKEAWLLIEAGPLAGKQFILYRPATTIGSSPKADICLLKDPAVAPQHLVLHQSGQEHLLLAAEGAVVAVNGRPVSRAHLRGEEVLTVGQTYLRYQLRAVAPGASL